MILSGTSRIHQETVRPLMEAQYPSFFTPLLNELRGGDMHGLSKKEIEVSTPGCWCIDRVISDDLGYSQEQYPAEHEKRVQDKLNYRYPGVGGESYLDVIERIRPVIIGAIYSL